MGKRFSRDILERLLSLVTEDEERKVLIESDDPVYWAENHFYDPDGGDVPFKAKEMFYDFLRTGGKDRAGRIGRQAGKCESKDTHIQLADGSWPTAEEIYSTVGEDGKFEILSTDMRTLRHIKTPAVITDNGVKSIIRVSTRSGFTTKNTDNHPYLVWCKKEADPRWVDASSLEPGMRIATSRDLTYCFVKDELSILSELEAELLGYLIGDGGTSQHTIRYTSENIELIDRINEILNKLNTGMKLKKCDYGKYDYSFITTEESGYTKGGSKRTWITDFVRKHKLDRKLSKHKVVPASVFRSSNNVIAAFLGAYLSTDGWVCRLTDGNRSQIGFGSSSHELLLGVRTLLLRLGIQSVINKRSTHLNEKTFISWQLIIMDSRYLFTFKEKITPIHIAKAEELSRLNFKENRSTTDTIPSGIWLKVKAYIRSTGKSARSLLNQDNARIRLGDSPNRRTFISRTKNMDDSWFSALGASDIFWDTIKTIELCGEEQTYAIYVPETNNLLTDNFITHNTVHTILDIMHTGAFSNNAIINVFVPEKKNMNRMLEIMANFLKNSDLKSAFQMGSSRKTMDTKNDVTPSYDYEIRVASGSVIRFFFMSNKPDKARGQRATHLYVDEADYLPVKAFDVITGIVKGNLGIKVTAISTPSGIDGSWFRKFCDACSKNGAEFHISTKQEKNWPEIEARLRTLIFDDVTWNLEVLAEWADAKGAVYKKECIDDAVNKSILDRNHLTKEDVYSMDEYITGTKWLGVDWNVPQNGVRLVEITQMFGNLWITRNHKISYENYTQTKAVEEVLNLHSIYRYKQISVDVGYGETQIELLMKSLSEKGQDPKVVLNLVDSQKKEETVIEYEQPGGGRRKSTIITRVKTKIVNLLAKAIETEIVFFKQDDERDDGIVKEVRNFRRKTAAMDGGFIYSDNTHSLSALQIGMHGVDKWRRQNGHQSSLCTEIVSTISLSESIKRNRTNNIAIQSSSFGIGTSGGKGSFVSRTGGLSGKTKRSLL